MNCERAQNHYPAFLEGALEPDVRRDLERHLAACPNCRELLNQAIEAESLSDLRPPSDFTDAVLARTSGGACARARSLLCDRIDAELDPIDRDLTAMHLAGCPQCAATQAALARLLGDLPSLGAMDPGPGFLVSVLLHTTHAGSRWSAAAARISRGWSRLVQKPRFAWEFAYVGSLLLWLAVGAIPTPLPAAPVALAPDSRAVRTVLAVRDELGRRGQNLTEATGTTATRTLDEVTGWISNTQQRSAAATRDVRRTTADLLDAAGELDPRKTAAALDALGRDLRTFWNRSVIGADTTTNPSTATPTDGDSP